MTARRLGLCLLAIACATAPAWAAAPSATPPMCADGAHRQRAHETGRRQGIALVESVWSAAHRDCARRDEVTVAVRRALATRTTPAGASEALVCRRLGVDAGADEALAQIAATCAGT